MVGASLGYLFSGRVIEARLCDITESGAAVIVNSVGSRASFRNPIARAVARAAGEDIKSLVHRYTLIKPGSVVVTHPGNHKTARYIFHTVVTSAEKNYYEDPEMLVRATTRCVQLADLLDLPSIAMPFFGTGVGRGQPDQVIKHMLNVIIKVLPTCESVEQIVFATINKQHLALFHNLALVDLALARREEELKDSLRHIPPALYGDVGRLLQRIEEARQAGNNPQELLEQANGLIKVGEELEEKLRGREDPFAGTLQLIIATGGSIIRNVNQQVGGGP